MKTFRINQIITHQMELEEKLKNSTTFEDHRKYESIHSFNVWYFKELEKEKYRNFKN